MSKYTEVPEFIQGNAALNELVTSIEKFKATKEKAVEAVTNVVKKIHRELNDATQKLDDARAKLVSEEIHQGKSTVATAKKLEEANEEVNRIKATMEAVSRMGGLAIVELEKRLQTLKARVGEINGLVLRIQEIPHTDIAGGRRKKEALLADYEKALTKIHSEIEEIEGTLKVLEEQQNKYGKLIFADSETVAAAKECVAIAAQAWNTRYRLSLELAKKIEDNENEIRRMKEENVTLTEALLATDPDSAGDYLYASEVELIVWPELRNIDDSTFFVKGKTRMNIKHLAQGRPETV